MNLNNYKKFGPIRIIEIFLGALLFIYMGFITSAAANDNATIFTWYKKMCEEVLPSLKQGWFGLKGFGCYKNIYNSYTLNFIFYATVVYILVLLVYLTNLRNYISGKEYGTGKLAEIKQVNLELSDKNTPKDKIMKSPYIKRYVFGLIKKEKMFVVNTMNRPISENISASLNSRQTDLNSNTWILGGSGAGKSFRMSKPVIMSMSSTFIITDPKGELVRDTAEFLMSNGFCVKVLNLFGSNGMKKSNKYNPFKYIREDNDVIKLITTLIKSTTEKDAQKGDPFWENSESLLYQALFFYILEKEPPERQNFRTVMEMLAMANVELDEDGNQVPSELDAIFSTYEREEGERIEKCEEAGILTESKGMSLAVQNYNDVTRAAPDTVRSIFISAKARLNKLKTKEILDLLSDDEMNIPELGAGVDFDNKTKTALFCVIPDSDTSYNFIVAMLYQQIFQELYHQADFVYDGQLPINVTFLMDEFANVALPNDFCGLLSTMRSRAISSIIITQNIAQLKVLFKDAHETVIGNCDYFIYLGGNEQSSHKFVSEQMGKGTYNKKSTSESKGKQGSSSKTDDVLGRELLMPDEVRKLNKKKCIVLIRGFDPIIDDKIKTQNKPWYSRVNNNHFVFDARNLRKNSGLSFLTDTSYKTLKKQEEIDGKLKVVSFDAKALAMLTAEQIDKYTREISTDATYANYISNEILEINEKKIKEIRTASKKEAESRITDTNAFSKYKNGALYLLKLRKLGFQDGKIRCLEPLIEKQMSIEEILSMFSPDQNEDTINESVNALLTCM